MESDAVTSLPSNGVKLVVRDDVKSHRCGDA